MSFTCFYILLLSSVLYLVKETSEDAAEDKARLDERVKLHNELNREYRNAECCKKKLKCCQLPNVPNIEIRAVLVRCPNIRPCAEDDPMRRQKEPVCEVPEHDIKQYHGFDEDEPVSSLSLIKCRNKLMLTIKISKHQFDPNRNQYIIVDHVYDPTTGRYARILIPYVIKFKQEPTMQLYELKFLHVVNSKVTEQILSKRTVQNFTGCDTTSAHPTCGRITYNGKVIPYSQGFCCSCDQYTNYLRQPPSVSQYSCDSINYGDPAYLLGGIECPRFVKGGDNINQAQDLLENCKKNENEHSDDDNVNYETPWESPLKKMKYHPLWSNTMTVKHPNSAKNYTIKIFSSSGNDHKGEIVARKSSENDGARDQNKNIPKSEAREKAMEYINDQNMKELDKEIENINSALRARKSVYNRLRRRQVQLGGNQRRGEQNCADSYTPKHVDKLRYHESAHCLRFSDIWFTVYHLQRPIVEHSIVFSIYEKHIDANGRIIWRDVTRGKLARVTTLTQKYKAENLSYSIEYSLAVEEVEPSDFALNSKAAVLLVPEDVSESVAKSKKYPEAKGGPSEYLVLHASQISLDGDMCNVAGVGFQGFAKQPNRCANRRGTCLLNQPYDLWLHDHQAEKQQLRGCFFLKYFGNIPRQPIRRIKGRPEKYLALEYCKPHATKINIEIEADFNTILRRKAAAKITEVYIDNACSGKVVITVKITNSGLTSSTFMTKMTDCPMEVPASFNNINSKQVLIPPQHQHVFTLVMECSLPKERFHCSIEALNYKNELVALRRIRLQKYDRCVCAWHCLCACIGSTEGIGCVPMSLQHYHAAGFQGSLPVTSFSIHYSLLDDTLSLLLYIFLSSMSILLLLGLLKAIIGLCWWRLIGIMGLRAILDLPKPIKRYYEPELRGKEVTYDSEGWPVHPETHKRTRNISRSTEVCINVVFFFVYPISVAVFLLKRICCPRGDVERERDDGIKVVTDYQIYQAQLKQTKGTSFKERSTTKSAQSEDDDVKLSTIISIQEGSESSMSESDEEHDLSDMSSSGGVGLDEEAEVEEEEVEVEQEPSDITDEEIELVREQSSSSMKADSKESDILVSYPLTHVDDSVSKKSFESEDDTISGNKRATSKSSSEKED